MNVRKINVYIMASVPPKDGLESMDVTPTVVGTSSGTEDEIITIAKEIFMFVKKNRSNTSDEVNTKLMEQVNEKYPDFCHTFQIIIRWMVMMGQFHPNALRLYLKKFKAELCSAFPTMRDYLHGQVDYIIFLQKELNPRWNKRAIEQYRKKLIDAMDEDHDNFENAKEEAAAEIKRDEEHETNNRRQEIYEHLVKLKLERSAPKA